SPIAQFNAARYLTASKVADKFENAAEKTAKARDRITKAIRGWVDWDKFEWELWSEVILFGAGIAGHIDRYSPWPRFFKLDEGNVPEFTGQNAGSVQTVKCNIDWLIHEFTGQVSDQAIAKAAGWD